MRGRYPGSRQGSQRLIPSNWVECPNCGHRFRLMKPITRTAQILELFTKYRYITSNLVAKEFGISPYGILDDMCAHRYLTFFREPKYPGRPEIRRGMYRNVYYPTIHGWERMKFYGFIPEDAPYPYATTSPRLLQRRMIKERGG